MLDEILQHKLAYTLLTFLLILHVIYFFAIWPDIFAFRVGAFSFGFSYFCWGVFAHVKAQHITKQIMREYFFAALLAVAIILMLTW